MHFHTWKKEDFQQYCPLIIIILTKCSMTVIYIMLKSFFGAITYSKDTFCFQESIFQWQISLISYRSKFWYLRGKPAVIFSKCLFFQNSLVIPWAIISSKMQEKNKHFFKLLITHCRKKLRERYCRRWDSNSCIILDQKEIKSACSSTEWATWEVVIQKNPRQRF